MENVTFITFFEREPGLKSAPGYERIRVSLGRTPAVRFRRRAIPAPRMLPAPRQIDSEES